MYTKVWDFHTKYKVYTKEYIKVRDLHQSMRFASKYKIYLH